MADFFSNGLVALVVFALMIVEGVVLAIVFRRTGKGIPPLSLLSSLTAGAGLVLALFASLTGVEWPWIAAALIVSLIGHVADVSMRWNATA